MARAAHLAERGVFSWGLAMMIAGGYLFLSSIRVYHLFNFGYSLFNYGAMHLTTTGMTLIPLILGIAMIFYNARNPFGWLLGIGSLVAICVGVIASIQFSFASMSLLDLLIILVLFVGGAGLFLSSLRSANSRTA